MIEIKERNLRWAYDKGIFEIQFNGSDLVDEKHIFYLFLLFIILTKLIPNKASMMMIN
jgi:hypothetical protein